MSIRPFDLITKPWNTIDLELRHCNIKSLTKKYANRNTVTAFYRNWYRHKTMVTTIETKSTTNNYR